MHFSIPVIRSVSPDTGRPHVFRDCRISKWDDGISPSSTIPIPWAINCRGRAAVSLGSSCRRLPAAAFLGLANSFSSRARCVLFSSSNPDLVMNTSPLTSSLAGNTVSRNASGILFIVRILEVTSSPVVPSPRVAARTSLPSLYSKLIARPSSFTSAV